MARYGIELRLSVAAVAKNPVCAGAWRAHPPWQTVPVALGVRVGRAESVALLRRAQPLLSALECHDEVTVC